MSCAAAAALTFGALASPASAGPTSPPQYAPSATLNVDTGSPGHEVEALWLDEWRDDNEKTVQVKSPAFEAPATLTFNGRQYAGKARLRPDARPGQAQARVVTHGGRAVKKAVFWIDPAKASSSGSSALVWLTGGALAAAGAGVVGVLAVRRRRKRPVTP
ncbi:hypothetical protein AQI95_42105 [Streptomyces yokosukanensis]|uniref:Gram-positive cocci surface proteins LPxTG domain-containing protein n=1 Tax=Streptomyces yokosukanensis TaxID=67386 RepID=A0A101NPT2_9ACTN|nr:hypothetical protein AQI95_42105 [Streptomyces yokosukanensis]